MSDSQTTMPDEPTRELLEAGWGYHYRLDTTLGRQKAAQDYADLLAAVKELNHD